MKKTTTANNSARNIMINKEFTSTADNKTYKCTMWDESGNVARFVDIKNDKNTVLCPFSAVKKMFTEKTETVKYNIPVARKSVASESIAKMDTFKQLVADIIHTDGYFEKGYALNYEIPKKKLVIRYVNKDNSKFENLTELFYKVRFNSVHCFIRRADIATDIPYDTELAEMNKARSYNMWIEYHIENTREALTDYIHKLLDMDYSIRNA